MGYKKTEQGTDTVFEVTPEAKPARPFGCAIPALKIVGIFLSFIIVLIIAGSLTSMLGDRLSGGVAILIWVVMPLGLWWLWVRGRQKRRKELLKIEGGRVASRFTVNAEGISLNGQLFKKKDIHRIVIKNPVQDAAEGQVVFGGSHAYNQGIRMGLAYRKQLADVSYEVQLESGGVAHVLAGGLTEPGAFAIQSDIAGILGFT